MNRGARLFVLIILIVFCICVGGFGAYYYLNTQDYVSASIKDIFKGNNKLNDKEDNNDTTVISNSLKASDFDKLEQKKVKLNGKIHTYSLGIKASEDSESGYIGTYYLDDKKLRSDVLPGVTSENVKSDVFLNTFEGKEYSYHVINSLDNKDYLVVMNNYIPSEDAVSYLSTLKYIAIYDEDGNLLKEIEYQMGTSFGIRVDSGTSKFAIDNIITIVRTDEYTGLSIFDSSANDFGNAVLYSDRLRYAKLGKCFDDGQYDGKVYEYTIKDGKVSEDVISTFGKDKIVNAAGATC
jgi:hypothetical protein